MNEQVFESVEKAVGQLKTVLAGFDASTLVRTQPTAMLELLTGAERALASTKCRVAKRAEETDAWIGSGQRSTEAWLAGVTGTSVGEAKRTLETAVALEGLPVVADALATGAVSEAQARRIAQTGDAAKGHETELVERAGTGNFRQLGDRCRQLESQHESATEEKARLARMHRRRGTRWWTEADGAHVVQTRFGPTQGPVAKAHHDAEVDGIFRLRRASQETERESLAAYGADAMFNLMCGRTVDGTPLHTGRTDLTDTDDVVETPGTSGEADTTTRSGRRLRVRPEVVFLIDYLSYRRGTTEAGETCELLGHGPVPVELARQFLDDAFIKAVICDGTDIKAVKHFGRSIPAELETALKIRDRGCAVPGCTNNLGIEVDHRKPFADGGELSLANADPLCRPHHHQKTRDRYRLEGPPGRRRWLDADGRIVAHDPDLSRSDAA